MPTCPGDAVPVMFETSQVARSRIILEIQPAARGADNNFKSFPLATDECNARDVGRLSTRQRNEVLSIYTTSLQLPTLKTITAYEELYNDNRAASTCILRSISIRIVARISLTHDLRISLVGQIT